jgi:hypothetical protein
MDGKRAATFGKKQTRSRTIAAARRCAMRSLSEAGAKNTTGLGKLPEAGREP